MANPDFAAGAFFKDRMVPKAISKHQKKVAQEKALADAYAIVDKREKNICQVSGVPLSPEAVDPKYRREHHHERGRRVMPEWREDPDHIFLVSALAHGLIENGWIVQEGEGAKTSRWHWADFVKPEQRIFRIKSRRRSQQK
jgi:hypothetical protein